MSTAGFSGIAWRAGNLSERMKIVTALGAPPAAPTVVDPLDSWKIDRLAGKLAGKFHKESLHRSVPPRHTKKRLAEVLTAYRLHELALGEGNEAAQSLLAEVHRAWLPTYQAALGRLDLPRDEAPTASWRGFDVYYGRLAKVCEPFLIELGRELSEALERADRGGATFSRKLIDDIQFHFLDRFELALAWAVEANTNVYCVQHGIDKARATRDDYIAYLDSTFKDAQSYHAFYLRFPVLGRWLAQLTRLLADYGAELIERLAADAAHVADAFFGQEIKEFRAFSLGRSDHHAGARSVAIVNVELADGGRDAFVYKPRCIRSEAAMQRLLGRLRDDDVLDFATRTVLPKDGYGYEALIPAGRNRVESLAEAGRVYEELGGSLGIFYILGGGDLHFENIIVADGHAYICDCETVLGAIPKGQGRPLGTLLDSVFKTGLLEWPRPAAQADGGPSAEMRISGYAGGEGYEMPIAVPQIIDRLSFAAAITHQTGIHVEPAGSNRVFLGERLMHPQEFTDSIMRGFDRVYAWFQRRPGEATRCVSEIFAGTSVRFINWGTQVYSQLLLSARHPKCLTEPLEVDLLTNTVRTFPRNWDNDGVLAERELSSMWRLDIPIFTADVRGNRLVHDHQTELTSFLELSPIDYAAERIRHLSDNNRVQQSRYIAAGLSVGEISNPSFVAACTDYASRVGLRLCEMLQPASAAAPWRSYQLVDDAIEEVAVEGDLYHGSAGIALFLAYLNEIAPRPEFRRAAERALAHAVACRDPGRIGAFHGLAGLIYLLTHLHRLWQDPKLLDLAVRLSRDLSRQIDDDKSFDVLSGAAGAIPVLLGLAHESGGAGIEGAHRCAEHLLRRAEADGETLSWPCRDPGEAFANLTGFSHGAGGIGWALISLGHATDRPDYISAGRRAFAYESRHFAETEQDWYDLRTVAGGITKNGRHFANAWCNGAAGIGLSRISSWALLGEDDETLLREAHQALAATMRNFPRLMNDTLCHGRSGNAELFLRFGVLRDEPAFQLEANVQVQAQWRNFDDVHSGAGDAGAGFFPGLMVGISGFGMHFLRLAHPDRCPSVLLLDPPPNR
ncbi:MAG TPA: type 2 lanthipeptide synthetase LanM family protein [Streptosporangiaceae bacterium]|nr:type 2 lanthipeptide synthetase LanM family protein [Streptosporangiaceae bacterium]